MWDFWGLNFCMVTSDQSEACNVGASVEVTVAPPSVQLPVKVLWKTVKDGPSAWAKVTHMADLALASHDRDCSSHLGSETTDLRSLSFIHLKVEEYIFILWHLKIAIQCWNYNMFEVFSHHFFSSSSTMSFWNFASSECACVFHGMNIMLLKSCARVCQPSYLHVRGYSWALV